jgi:hypothetical protein
MLFESIMLYTDVFIYAEDDKKICICVIEYMAKVTP